MSSGLHGFVYITVIYFGIVYTVGPYTLVGGVKQSYGQGAIALLGEIKEGCSRIMRMALLLG